MRSFVKAYLLLSGLTFGCTHIERVDTTAVKEHMSDYKIKKISPSEIIEQAEKFGTAAIPAIEKQLNDPQLTAQWNCDFKKSSLADSLKLSERSIRLILKADLKNVKSFLPKEVDVLDAYRYSFEKKLRLETNIQQLNDTLYLYTYPVPQQTAFSKSCISGDPDYYAVIEILLNKSFLIKQMK